MLVARLAMQEMAETVLASVRLLLAEAEVVQVQLTMPLPNELDKTVDLVEAVVDQPM